MQRPITRLTRAIGIACVLMTGAAAAQNVVNGPYYATPSWDQTMPASARFVVLANFNGQAVLDRETGLVWQRAVNPGNYDAFALTFCHLATTGGRYGWRLPAAAELTSLFDPAVTTLPTLPAGHPFIGFDNSEVHLWTSSRQVSSGRRDYVNVTTEDGAPRLVVRTIADGSDTRWPYLCVRGGSGGDDS